MGIESGVWSTHVLGQINKSRTCPSSHCWEELWLCAGRFLTRADNIHCSWLVGPFNLNESLTCKNRRERNSSKSNASYFRLRSRACPEMKTQRNQITIVWFCWLLSPMRWAAGRRCKLESIRSADSYYRLLWPGDLQCSFDQNVGEVLPWSLTY